MKTVKKNNVIIRLAKHPLGLYLLWLMILVVFCFTGIPLLSIGYADGEQRPLILLGYTMDVAVAVLIIISFISPFVYWWWYKKYMFIPLIIPLLIASLLIYWIINIYISNGHHFPL